MKKLSRIQREIVLSILIIVFFIALVNFLYRDKLPKKIPIDLHPAPQLSGEEKLLKAALKEPEAVLPQVLQEPALPTTVIPTQDATSVPQQPDQSAPELNPETLSPALRRSVEAAQSLRTEAFIQPESEMNRQTVESLREIRRARHNPTLPELPATETDPQSAP